LRHLQSLYPLAFPDDRIRRTLERRIRQWRALNGPERDIIFRQSPEPGYMAQSDFTHADDLGVMIAGKAFPHLLYRFVMVYSRTGGFLVKRVFYSAPSQLIGQLLRVHVYDDRIEAFLGTTLVVHHPRARGRDDGHRVHVVNYHHVIHALRRKSQALYNSVYRDNQFPRTEYAETWKVLQRDLPHHHVPAQFHCHDACRIRGYISRRHRNGCRLRGGHDRQRDKHRLRDLEGCTARQDLGGQRQQTLTSMTAPVGKLVCNKTMAAGDIHNPGSRLKAFRHNP
jgi:hypothetical protein